MNTTRVGIDAMGGDYAPLEAIKAVVNIANSELTNSITPVLYGHQETLNKHLVDLEANPDNFEIIHCNDVIKMGEHPTKALTQKRNSSIAVGFQQLAEGKIDAFIGAGNTGAMHVGAMFSVKAIEGVLRPTITTVLPRPDGSVGIMLDVGANADCKPEVLNQFATLGSLFYKAVYSTNNQAKVGLLNIGEEKEKGNILTQATYPLLEANQRIEFIGNIEGRDLLSNKADVIVCDGFTGNILLKFAEGLYYNLVKRGVNDEYLNRFNFKYYGGTPILGVNAPVIIGHGISKAETFVKLIELAKDVVDSKMIDKIKAAF
ncbi:MAG: phosphate acyltransferase PlsX [Bacteroidia bacterium]|nr:phosphate acyltransferase PlsX [Bacteroidia bacterium]